MEIVNLFGDPVNESVYEAKRMIGSRFVEKSGAEEDEVNTSSRCYTLPMLGQTFRAKPEEVTFVTKLDDMEKDGRSIFGGGFLMSEEDTARYVEAQGRAAQGRAAQGRATFFYRLSERERALVAKKKEEGEQ